MELMGAPPPPVVKRPRIRSPAIWYACIIDEREVVGEKNWQRKEQQENLEDTLLHLKQVLSNPDQQTVNHRKTVTHEKGWFHYLYCDGTVFLCVAAPDMSTRTCFAFLEAVESDYEKMRDLLYIGEKEKKHKKSLSPQLGLLLNSKMDFFNDPRNDKVVANIALAEEVKSIMIENAEMLLMRGTMLEKLTDDADALVEQAQAFKKEARRARRVFWCRNLKAKICLIICFIVLIIIIICVVCAALPFFGIPFRCS